MITATTNTYTQYLRKEDFNYIDIGEGQPLIFLHGLFGGLSNWDKVIRHFAYNYRVLVPQLPLLDLDIRKANLDSLVEFVKDFQNTLGLTSATLVGNSLGGHVALLYTLRHPHRVASLVLVGSSGLYESSFGNTFPKRGDYDYVKNKVSDIFYNKEVVTEQLVDDVYQTTRSISNSLKIVNYAKSAQRNNLSDDLGLIKVPTQIIWGENDPVTPVEVSKRFHEAIKNSELALIPNCGHVPMMETPETFNILLGTFLSKTLKGL
jgi:pimeloyl-ACP methyl ester carboxylesterase